MEPTPAAGIALLLLAVPAHSGLDREPHHISRNTRWICVPHGMAERAERTPDPADPGRDGSFLSAARVCDCSAGDSGHEQRLCNTANGIGGYWRHRRLAPAVASPDGRERGICRLHWDED